MATITKVKNKLNYVSITIVMKTGQVIKGQARDFMFHTMDKEFVVDWLYSTEPFKFKYIQVESFMVTR